MKIAIFSKPARNQLRSQAESQKQDLLIFAQTQFKELSKKNLSIPVKLYQL